MNPRIFERLLTAALLSAAIRALPGEAYPVAFEGNVPMVTRDGVTLRSDIYRPKADGNSRCCSSARPTTSTAISTPGLKGAARGYVVIIQDVRGRNASEGDWYPFKYEAADGYDSVEWAAALPYSDGKVAMIGGSYVGPPRCWPRSRPPAPVAINPVVTASNYHEHWAYQGGAFMQLLAQAWSSALAVNGVERRAGASAAPAHWDYRRPPSEYPVIDPGKAAGLADYYFDWIAHPAYDDYWKQWSIEERYGQITVPVLIVAAWYDLFQDGSIRNYVGIRRRRGHGGGEGTASAW